MRSNIGKILLTALTICLLIAVLGATPLSTLAQSSQPYNWRNVYTGGGGGFIPGIIFNETESNLVYVRTDIGGAYRLDPATNRWIPLLDSLGWDDWGLTGVVSLATDPIEPNRLYVAGGTYTNDWDPKPGAILRSTDKGATWARTTLPFKLGGNMPGRGMGERLMIDPNKNSILYLGAPNGNGLWRSTDYGVTWSKVTNFPDVGPFAPDPTDPNGYLSIPVGVVWVLFDKNTGTPGNATQTIYVGTAQNGSGMPNIFRSTDAGATWAAIPGEPVCTQAGTIVTCTGGASWDRNQLGDDGSRAYNTGGYMPHQGRLDPSGTLYVAYSNWEGPYNGNAGDVFKYVPSTNTWTKISPIPGSDRSNNFFGYSGLTIDKQNPNVIMVTGYSSWWPDTMIWRSTNGGTTWSRIWDWTRYPNRSYKYTQDVSAAPWLKAPPRPVCGGGRPGAEINPKLGWMTESLQIDPHNSNRMMYGTGATLYGTTNLTNWDVSATSQIAIKVMAMGIEETAVLDLISPPSGAPLLSALGDIAGFVHNDLTVVPAAQFTPVNGTNTSIDFAELSPSYVVRVGNADLANCEKSLAISTNGGSSWAAPTAQPAGVTGGGNVAVSATGGGKIVWSPSGVGVYYTTNGGKGWSASAGIPAGARVASDRVNPNKFYGFGNGKFYVSTNSGASFTASAAAGLPATGDPVRLEAVPGREGDIWLAGGSTNSGVYGLWHSTDSGATFTKLANVQEADAVGFGKAAPGQTYMAIYISAKINGVRGIYRSDNAGATWVRINDDQHQYAWTGAAITGDPRTYGRVYVATNGRGILYGDVSGAIAGGSSIVPTNTPTR